VRDLRGTELHDAAGLSDPSVAGSFRMTSWVVGFLNKCNPARLKPFGRAYQNSRTRFERQPHWIGGLVQGLIWEGLYFTILLASQIPQSQAPSGWHRGWWPPQQAQARPAEAVRTGIS